VSQAPAINYTQLADGELDELLLLQKSENFDEIEEKCAADPLCWAQNYTATENPHYIQQGLSFIAPFPKKAYFGPLFESFQKWPRLFIPKTREMMTSWCAMVYAVWCAQWYKAEVIVQTESEEKAKRLVGYGACLYRNQVKELKERHPLLKEPALLEMEWADGGKLFGIPKGEHKIRMYHPTLYLIDEAAFLPEAEACYNAAHPVARQIIAISSAGPGWFGNMCAR
jgi:hypothetical protein